MVAAAVYVQAGEPSHSAIIIRYEGETHSLHYFGRILLEPPGKAIATGTLVAVRELDFIPPFLLPSFIAHCELIAKHAQPEYGYFYDPRSFYDASGKFQNPGGLPEYLTCVGFCLTVIQSYLNPQEYLYYADWDKSTFDQDPNRQAYQMVQIKRNNPSISENDLLASVRRILPIEYFSGAYSGNLPVRKKFTDSLSGQLLQQIKRLVAWMFTGW
jgi:hypothetical protein